MLISALCADDNSKAEDQYTLNFCPKDYSDAVDEQGNLAIDRLLQKDREANQSAVRRAR